MATNFGVIESTDQGRSWFYACEDPEQSADARLYTLVQDAERERLFSIGAQGLAVSDDSGCRVQPTAGSRDGVIASDYFVDPTNAARALVLASVFDFSAGVAQQSSVLLLSVDGTQTFAPALRSVGTGDPDSLDFESVEISRKDPLVTYLVSSSIVAGRQLERSSDGGLTWTRTPLPAMYGSRFGIITIHPNNPDKVFLRGSNSASDFILLTTDGGKTITPVLDLTAQMAVVTAFLIRQDGTILVGVRGGTDLAFGLRSTDGGLTYQPWPIGGLHLRGLAEHQQRLYALAEFKTDPFILARSDDDGATWDPMLTANGTRQETTGIKGIKPCAQARCYAACLELAGKEVLPAANCKPPNRDAGGQGGDGEGGGGTSGCGCVVARNRTNGGSHAQIWASLGAALLFVRAVRTRRRRSSGE
ncbi:MAG: hypothetical protein H7X95_09935 [Deltaproteobacteria bacterium]|nr:hypothetical protein [Deltaproteobacteria bacterium]